MADPQQHYAQQPYHQSPTQSKSYASHHRSTDDTAIDDDDGSSGDESILDDATGKRKRQRRPVSVSCELCKQRKVKCDRGQPSCGWCTRNGQVCEYRERRKPGLRAGYGRELEGRLDKLEGVLQTQQVLLQQLANHIQATPLPPQIAHNTPSPVSAISTARTQPEPLYTHRDGVQYSSPHDRSLMNPQPYAPHRNSNGMPPPQQLHQSQPHNTLPPLQQSASTARMQAAPNSAYDTSNPPLESPSLNIPGASPASSTAISAAQDTDLPPYDLLYSLVDLFFKHINPWAPILHRRSTLDTLFGTSGLDEADRILLHAILATALKFSNDPRLDAEARERYYTRSKQKVLLYGLDNSSVRSLQALVVLALDIVGFSNGPPGWNLLALITRSVVQLGLAVETNSMSVTPQYPSIYTLRAMVLPEPKDFIEDESRRRLFWIIYLLDRYATIATAFEFALDDKEIDRKLPCREEHFNRNQPVETRWFSVNETPDRSDPKAPNMGAFSYYIEILGILSRVHRFLKKPVDIGALPDVEQWQREYRELDTCLNRWKFSLPLDFGNMSLLFSPEGARVINCMWIMLHITYHTVVIRLHSSAAYPTIRSPIFTPSYSASQRCHNAVEDVCSLCAYVRQHNMLSSFGPCFAFSLWVAARLLLVHGSTIDHHVNPAIGPLVETLREMGTNYKVAERYAALLQRVLDEFSESESAAPDGSGERTTPSTVKILADMRRTAYDLDFLISRQPRHSANGKVVSITPARTPAPNELEYLDVFDFFNMPRLPVPQVDGAAGTAAGGGTEMGTPDLGANSEFNITNFMYDANSDWFTRGEG